MNLHNNPVKPGELRRATSLVGQYRKLLKSTIYNSRTTPIKKERVLLSEQMPFGTYGAGAFSFPGPDVTFTPPPSNPGVVNLGCLSSSDTPGTKNITWPQQQTPANFATGSTQRRYEIFRNAPLTVITPQSGDAESSGTAFGFLPRETLTTGVAVPSATIPNDGQPGTQTLITDDSFITNSLVGGISTPFQGSITAGGPSGYVSVTVSGYTDISLAQEGLLWTLWPLAKHTNEKVEELHTYFDGFHFGTAKASHYAIGQLGYFYNDRDMGCIPISSSTAVAGLVDPQINNLGIERAIISGLSTTHNTGGIQGFNSTLLLSTAQLLSILVVKVSEEIARVFNPAAGSASDNRFIYVGYDGWAVIRTTHMPVGSLAAQTYVTPQSITGTVVQDNNYQVIFPPNFVQTLYFKDTAFRPPVSTENGLIPAIPCVVDPNSICNLSAFNQNFDPNSGPGPRPFQFPTN